MSAARPRASIGVAAVTLLSLATPAAQNPPAAASAGAQLPTFRGGANLVLVDAYPRRNGKVVEGLTAADFEIFEDGKPVAVQTFEFVRANVARAESERRDPNTVGDMLQQAADPRSRVFVAFLDTLHATVESGAQVRGPLVNVLNRLVGADDLFGVMTPQMRPRDITFGRRLLVVEEELQRHWTWGLRQRAGVDESDPMEQDLRDCFRQKLVVINGQPQLAPWLVDDGGARRQFDEVLIERRREDRTFTSLEDLVEYLGSIREARSAVLPITDGWMAFERGDRLAAEMMEDERFREARREIPMPGFGRPRAPQPGTTVSNDPQQFLRCALEVERLARLEDDRRLRDLTRLAERNNVSFFPVAVNGLTATDGGAAERLIPSDMATGQTVLGRDLRRMTSRVQSLRTVAEATGGIAAVNSNDLSAGFTRIVDELASYYLLSYAPLNPKADGRFRRIEVKVKTPGIEVRARAGYVPIPVAEAAAVAAPDPARMSAEAALTVLARARPGVELVTTASLDGPDVVIVAELGESVPRDPTTPARVEVDVAPMSGGTAVRGMATIEPGVRGALVRVLAPAGAGPWRVTSRVVLAGRTLQDGLELGVPAGAGVLGRPLVYRATPSPRSPLSPVATLTFRRTERVHVEWPLARAVDTVSARLLDRQGRALAGNLAAAATTSASGHSVAAVDLNLNPFPEGDYVIAVTASAGGATEEGLQAFRVVR